MVSISTAIKRSKVAKIVFIPASRHRQVSCVVSAMIGGWYVGASPQIRNFQVWKINDCLYNLYWEMTAEWPTTSDETMLRVQRSFQLKCKVRKL